LILAREFFGLNLIAVIDLLLSNEIEVLCKASNLKKILSLGIKAEKGDSVKLTYMQAKFVSQNLIVECKCIYCDKVFKQKIRRREHFINDCCYNKKCIQKNNEFKFELKHGKGIKNPGQIKEVREKIENTCQKRFGASSPFGSKDVIKKREQNNLKKYGKKNVGSLPETREKIKNTCQKRYGTDSVFQAREVKEKISNTLKNRYGSNITNVSQIPEVRKKINNTLIENSEGTNINTSKEQKHIKDLINGFLNYKIGRKRIDIVRLDLMIAYEVDGRGHFAYSKNEDFEKQELEREELIFKAGFKLVRIVFDLEILSDEKMLKLISYCNTYLLSCNERKIIVDLRNNTITTSKTFDLKRVIQ